MTDIPKLKRIYLKDYKKSDYIINHVEMIFRIHESKTEVEASLYIERASHAAECTVLKLNGERLKLHTVHLNDRLLNKDEFEVDEAYLKIEKVPEKFILKTLVDIYPHENTSLEGFYKTGEILCTQNEPNGFRFITYFIDRFDTLSTFKVRIEADKSRYPVLLANGNEIEKGNLPEGRHFIVWNDPVLKNPNVFALVAADLAILEDSFTTMSGRKVILRSYVDKGNEDRAQFTLEALKKGMAFDEKEFHREYDLDFYSIVAVDAFNFGAMENKGLNIFNSKAALVSQATATDADYRNVEVIVVHEYLHNWTGNRISCRDSFQMTQKEGLTVFRDQRYSETHFNPELERLRQVKLLRSEQFPEDAGPTAHPIRPESIGSANNVYTRTVYKKGAEVIRMIETLLGKEVFARGLQLYFDKFDGKAVCTEHFLECMYEVSGVDLYQFEHWYSQAGTPKLVIKDEYSQEQKKYTLYVSQSCPATSENKVNKPFHLPLAIGLLDKNGSDIFNRDNKGTRILELKRNFQSFTFFDIEERPTPSLLRNFSAPVTVNYPYTQEQLLLLLKHDSDTFSRYESAQSLIKREIWELISSYQNNYSAAINYSVYETMIHILHDESISPALKAEFIQVPDACSFIEEMDICDFEAVEFGVQKYKSIFAEAYKSELSSIYNSLYMESDNSLSEEARGYRCLKNTILALLMSLQSDEAVQAAFRQFNNAGNMTDEKAALFMLTQVDCPEADSALSRFYDKWQDDQLVMNSWFTAQASSRLPGALERVKKLEKDRCFDIANPNKISSLYGALAANLVHFHDKSGECYEFIADKVLEIDRLNPSASSRLSLAFKKYKKLDPLRQKLMKEQIDRLLEDKNLSGNSRDHLEKILYSKDEEREKINF